MKTNSLTKGDAIDPGHRTSRFHGTGRRYEVKSKKKKKEGEEEEENKGGGGGGAGGGTGGRRRSCCCCHCNKVPLHHSPTSLTGLVIAFSPKLPWQCLKFGSSFTVKHKISTVAILACNNKVATGNGSHHKINAEVWESF